MNSRHWAAVILVACSVAAASAGISSVDGGSVLLVAEQGDPSLSQYSMLPPLATIPQTRSGSATAGASDVSLQYRIRTTGLAFTSSMDRDGSYVDDNLVSMACFFGGMDFTVDADSTYTISGQHALTGSQRVTAQVYFTDLTANTTLFSDYQYSEYTTDEVLVLGQLTGEYNDLSGAATGPLIAGHQYSLSFNYMIVNPLGTDTGASSVGNINVAISPEPTSALLLALGLIGMLRRR